MRPDLRPMADAVGAGLEARPFIPDIETDKDGCWDAPYDNRPDKDRWWALLFNLFETRQQAVVQTFFDQLTKLVPDVWNDKAEKWEPDTQGLRSILGMIQSMNPQTTAEAAYAAQLVALHIHMMRLGAGIASYRGSDARTVATMARVTRTFGDGLLTLKSLQGEVRESKQTITVETHHHHHQHIHYETHTGGGQNFGGRADATADGGEIISSAALPSPDQAGQALRLASGGRKARVPNARRGQGKRGQKGPG